MTEETLKKELAEAKARYTSACELYSETEGVGQLRKAKDEMEDVQFRLDALHVAQKAKEKADDAERVRQRAEAWAKTKKAIREVFDRRRDTAEEMTGHIQALAKSYAKFKSEEQEAARLLQPWRLGPVFFVEKMMPEFFNEKISAVLNCADAGPGGGMLRAVTQHGASRSYLWDRTETLAQLVETIQDRFLGTLEAWSEPPG